MDWVVLFKYSHLLSRARKSQLSSHIGHIDSCRHSISSDACIKVEGTHMHSFFTRSIGTVNSMHHVRVYPISPVRACGTDCFCFGLTFFTRLEPWERMHCLVWPTGTVMRLTNEPSETIYILHYIVIYKDTEHWLAPQEQIWHIISMSLPVHFYNTPMPLCYYVSLYHRLIIGSTARITKGQQRWAS